MNFNGNLFLGFGRFRQLKIYLCLYVLQLVTDRRNYQRWSIKRMFLKTLQNSQETTCVGTSYLIKLQAALKKETPAQVFSCEFCEILKNASYNCFQIEYKYNNTKMIGMISYPISSSLVSKCFSSLLLKMTFTLFSNFPLFSFFHFPILLLLLCSPVAVESHMFFLLY